MGLVVALCVLWLVAGNVLFLKRFGKGNLGCGLMFLAAMLGPFEFFLAVSLDSLSDDD
jgi:hypothetical protein